jgi:hypothetical protein
LNPLRFIFALVPFPFRALTFLTNELLPEEDESEEHVVSEDTLLVLPTTTESQISGTCFLGPCVFFFKFSFLRLVVSS